jgi:nitroimidazol reductase NimA-like FMN-containing flavoprotein (pyridoxamine 5'-phosphate oxidase superfamily)
MKMLHNRKTVGTFGIDELTKLNAKTLHAVLATAYDNIPYTSLVAYAFDHQEQVFLFLTPRKTTKYTNIRRNPNVSLLIDTRENTDRDYLSGEAFTVLGKALALKASKKRERLLNTFLNKHPKLADFSKEPSTAVIAVNIGRCFKVTKFQEVFNYSS